jgi:hypothetical protein
MMTRDVPLTSIRRRLVAAALLLVCACAWISSPAYGSFAQDVTPEEFLRRIQSVTQIGDLTRSVEVQRALGLPLKKLQRQEMQSFRPDSKPAWLLGFDYHIRDAARSKMKQRLSLRLDGRIFCITPHDVRAVFGPGYSWRAILEFRQLPSSGQKDVPRYEPYAWIYKFRLAANVPVREVRFTFRTCLQDVVISPTET